MPNNIPIQGDDVQWKRSVDSQIVALNQTIAILKQQIQYLMSRVK